MATLFETDAEPSAPPDWLKQALKDMGQHPATVERMTAREAAAVRDKILKARATGQARQSSPTVGEKPYREPDNHGASPAERAQIRVELAADLEAYAAGTINAWELYRVIRGSSYVLTTAELVELGRALVAILERQL